MFSNLGDVWVATTKVDPISTVRMKKVENRFRFLKPIKDFSLKGFFVDKTYDEGKILWFSSVSDCLLAAEVLKAEGFTSVLLEDTWRGGQPRELPFCVVTDCSFDPLISKPPVIEAYFVVKNGFEYLAEDLKSVTVSAEEEMLVSVRENFDFLVPVDQQIAGQVKFRGFGSWKSLNETKNALQSLLNTDVELVICSW